MINRAHLSKRLATYQATAIFSIVFALLGFSYNAWRLEASEHNTTVRTASFEILVQLSEFERVLYAAHYDNDPTLGNPRAGWVKLGIVNDLAPLVSTSVQSHSQLLTQAWQSNWQRLGQESTAITTIEEQKQALRMQIQRELAQLN
ncbi:hypothetical protein [Paraferrimonas haliotis]|uniref:Uncharacterized protein n=1 Tax=Paraferrimonas haliotis TaxID=2013866 RepID=A0AA37TUL2_9GAMM|nr:hypothetical protein [Paraferrimonas haliotis]GLS82046.1 hypothetical protein GCM10007894_00230 [Paraferrimonas haliotis]